MKIHQTIALLLISSPSLYAKDYFELSLEELMNVDVSVGGKAHVPLDLSPGAISSYGKSFLKNYQLETLSELVDITPGMSSYLGYGERSFETRGQKVAGFDNNHHVVFIDGIPINHARNSRAPMEEELPLTLASEIQILKGPASTTYGNNAYAGVIKINLEDRKLRKGQTYTELGFGNDHQKKVRLKTRSQFSKVNFNLNLGYFGKEAEDSFAGPASRPENVDWKNRDNKDALFIATNAKVYRGAFKGLGVGYIHLKKDSGMGAGFFGSSAGFHESNRIQWESSIPYLKYKRKLSDTLSTNSFLKYNKSTENSHFANTSSNTFSNYDITVENIEGNIEFNYLTQTLGEFVFGVNHDVRRRKGRPYSYEFISTPSAFSSQFGEDSVYLRNHSAFIENTKIFNAFKGLNLTLGARWDKSEGPNSDFERFSPRLATVVKFTDQFRWKVMYASALRSPNLKNLLLNQQAISENLSNSTSIANIPTNLKAEAIKSLETSFIYENKGLLIALHGFLNRQKDKIERETRNGKSVFVNNIGSSKAWGGEFEVKYDSFNVTNLFFNLSYAKSTLPKGEGEGDFADVPTLKANLGAFYQLGTKSSYYLGHISRWVKEYRTNTTGDDREEGSLIHDLILDYRWDRSTIASLKIRNLFNTDYHHPISGSEADVLPHRNLLASMSFEF